MKEQQAFPSASLLKKSKGMTLKDYFAAQAMASIVTTDIEWKSDPFAVALRAYRMAEAMMDVR